MTSSAQRTRPRGFSGVAGIGRTAQQRMGDNPRSTYSSPRFQGHRREFGSGQRGGPDCVDSGVHAGAGGDLLADAGLKTGADLAGRGTDGRFGLRPECIEAFVDKGDELLFILKIPRLTIQPLTRYTVPG
ncbi:hypothetical protein ACH492_27550 [Streptomyces sp. NPDC019443]|uniref:hypothetical protein n=1 Tax=Streptomyces sp. NPDC019443 TaxID=3365061 RepID=UPI0037AC71B4